VFEEKAEGGARLGARRTSEAQMASELNRGRQKSRTETKIARTGISSEALTCPFASEQIRQKSPAAVLAWSRWCSTGATERTTAKSTRTASTPAKAEFAANPEPDVDRFGCTLLWPLKHTARNCARGKFSVAWCLGLCPPSYGSKGACTGP